MTDEAWIDLKCHAPTRTEILRGIKVLVRRSANELRASFRLDGTIAQVKLPRTVAPRIGTDLWRHTCFEVFVAVEGHGGYHEFNFAPSREWTVYSFSGYRDGGPVVDDALHPDIEVRITDRTLELDAVARLNCLSSAHLTSPLRVGLSAVIEAADGFSYWAIRHPNDKPDFHDPAGFALILEPRALT